jgi:cold shock CspA family protein
MSKKRIGVITRFGNKGFGFLTEPATQREYFVHIGDVVGRLTLMAGQEVEFEEEPIARPGKPPRAVLVRLLLRTPDAGAR